MKKNQIENYLENECSFRDYQVRDASEFRKLSVAGSINLLDPDKHEIDDALDVFSRDGYSQIILYLTPKPEKPRYAAKKLTFERWTKECQKKRRTWKKAEINAVIKSLQSANFGEYKSAVDLNVAFHGLKMSAEYGSFEHSITKEQSDFGIEYLTRRYFKKDGEPRKYCPFGFRERGILKAFKRFTFVGFYSHESNYGGYTQYTPVYRVYSKNGQHFDYTPIHWGIPMIVG